MERARGDARLQRRQSEFYSTDSADTSSCRWFADTGCYTTAWSQKSISIKNGFHQIETTDNGDPLDEADKWTTLVSNENKKCKASGKSFKKTTANKKMWTSTSTSRKGLGTWCMKKWIWKMKKSEGESGRKSGSKGTIMDENGHKDTKRRSMNTTVVGRERGSSIILN